MRRRVQTLRRLLVASLVALGLGLVVGPVVAQDTSRDVPVAEDQRAATSLRLTRAEAARMAAERNYGLLIEAMEREAAAEGTRAARQGFMPVLRLEGSYLDALGGDGRPGRRQINLGSEVRWSSPIGTSLALGVDVQEQIAGVFFPHSAALFMTAVQRLLRGGGQAGAATPALEADLGAERQRAVFRQRLNALLVDVESAYWELAFAQADLESRRRSLERARAQFEDTRENIRRGLLAEADIYIVEENQVIFEEQVIRAEEVLALARSRMARLLQMDPASMLEAAEGLEQDDLSLPDTAQATEVALRESPAMAARRLQLELADVRLAFEENQTMPVLDLEASLTLNGAGDSVGAPWSDIGGLDQPEVRVGVVFEVPLSDDAFEGRVARQRLARRQQLTALKDDEAALQFQVRELLISLDAQARRLALARRRVELAGLKLEAQMDKYRNGISTLDEVVRFQRDLDGAIIAARRVQVGLLVDFSRLREAQGVLHRVYGVEVE